MFRVMSTLLYLLLSLCCTVALISDQEEEEGRGRGYLAYALIQTFIHTFQSISRYMLYECMSGRCRLVGRARGQCGTGRDLDI